MKRRLPLSLTIGAVFAAIVLAAVAAATWRSVAVSRGQSRAYNRAMLQGIAGLVAGQLAPLLGDPEALASVCADAARRANVRVTLIGADGRVLAESDHDAAVMESHADRAEIAQILDGAEFAVQDRYSDTFNNHMLYVAVPLHGGDGARAGVCRIARRMTDIENLERRAARRIFFCALACAFAAVAAGLLLSRAFLAPLVEMQRAARRMRGNDFAVRLPESGFREFASIARSFNFLCAALEQRIDVERRQRAQLEAILAAMTEGVLAIDAGQRVILANHAAGLLFGSDPSDMAGRDIREIIRHPELARVLDEPLPAGGLIERDISFPLGGDTRACLLHAAALPADGRLLVLTDVTRLRRLMTLRKDFASSVSHELRTPVTALLGFIETLLDGALEEPENARRFLNIIHAHTLRLRALINDLLALTRIEREEENGLRDTEPAPLRPLVLQALEDHRLRAEARHIALVDDIPGDLSARVDAGLFVQAVANLVDNAVAYSSEGGVVHVSAFRDTAGVHVTVRDEGCGIPAADLDRVFERFYRVDKSRRRDNGGTGLGLAIVKHIMQAHAGSVSVASTPGRGSTFHLVFPL